jgi:hypothetical protein
MPVDRRWADPHGVGNGANGESRFVARLNQQPFGRVEDLVAQPLALSPPGPDPGMRGR